MCIPLHAERNSYLENILHPCESLFGNVKLPKNLLAPVNCNMILTEHKYCCKLELCILKLTGDHNQVPLETNKHVRHFFLTMPTIFY